MQKMLENTQWSAEYSVNDLHDFYYSLAMQRISIVPGLSMPFFPMRPSHGPSLTKESDVHEILASIDCGNVVQSKLNGDRLCLAVVNGKVYIQNRHGGWAKGTCNNKEKFLEITEKYFFGGPCCLDGELFGKEFHPFEVLVIDGKSLMRDGPETRVSAAKEVCRHLGMPFFFNTPTAKWMMNFDKNCPHWEGVVIKKRGTPYVVMSSASGSSSGISKRKWCK